MHSLERKDKGQSPSRPACVGEMGLEGQLGCGLKKTPKTWDIKGQMVYAIIIIFNSTKKLSSPDYELGIILRDENRKKRIRHHFYSQGAYSLQTARDSANNTTHVSKFFSSLVFYLAVLTTKENTQ